ncbi:MAG: STAS domain-containing protein [Leptospira sp.]|nr:STAS domain-containing protein [Leptospira sp.]
MSNKLNALQYLGNNNIFLRTRNIMQVAEREIDSIPVIDLKGEVTLYDTADFMEAMKKCISNQKTKVIVNLSSVTFMDSTGVGTIIKYMMDLRKLNGGLKLSAVKGSVANLFAQTAKKNPELIYETDEEAVQAFLNGP